MKILSLHVLLLLAALAAQPLAYASSYLAEGVDAANLVNSSRFYDNGKGYYWSFYGLSNELDELYAKKGDVNFIGDLADYLPGKPAQGQSFSNYVYQHLGNDANTCWYNTSANVIQYWQSYYGVFYQGTDPLPYGHTYDKQYATQLGGTQSLKVDMFFYDNIPNVGGNFMIAADWYFQGKIIFEDTTPHAIPGYFNSYFANLSSADKKSRLASGLSTDYIVGELASHFGGHLDESGNFAKDTVGQIVSLGLTGRYVYDSSMTGGHAITCYGFETLANDIIKLQVTNSDDLQYKLFDLYAKKGSDGFFHLYEDEACSKEWTYADYAWYIDEFDSVQTPQALKEMYAQYTDKDNAMVWNGQLDSWSGTYEAATTEELPTEATGWDVYASSESHKGFFHSFYDADRVTEFGDHATNTNVSVSGPVSSGGIVISATQKDYVFSGVNGASIATGDIRLTGARKASFADVSISAAHVTVGSGSTATLSLGPGAALTAEGVQVSRLATFELNGGSASIASGGVTLDSGATLAIAAPSSLTVQAGGALVANDGAIFSFTLPQGSNATPLLTYTGNFTLNGNCTFVFNGTTPQANDSFALISFADPSQFSSQYLDRIGVEDGYLAYSGGILSYIYTDLGTLTWGTGSGAWNADSWNHGATETANRNVEFSADGAGGAIAISGEVAPGRILVSGNSYQFTGSGSIGGRSDVTITGVGTALEVGVAIENRHIRVQDGASVTFSKQGGSTIERLTMESGTMATFSQEYTVNQSQALNGNLSLVGAATLNLALDSDMALNGSISSVAGTALKFSNSSAVKDIAYSLSGDTSAMNGSVIVGDDTDAWGTTLKASVNSGNASSYSLASKGTLEISGDNSAADSPFYNSVSGSGTLKVAKDAQIAFDLNISGKASFDNTLTLAVEGTATIGNSYYGLQKAPIAKHVIVNGGTLNLTYSAADGNLGAVSATDKLTLGNKGTVNVDFALYANPHIKEVEMQGDASIYMVEQMERSYSESRNINIDKLTGSGNLTLASGLNLLNKYKLATAENYLGNITVQSDSTSYGYYGSAIVTSLELDNGFSSTGTITLDSGTSYARVSSLGIKGNATIGGLSGDEAAFLYSGSIVEYEAVTWNQTAGDNVAYSDFKKSVLSQESTLTINVESGTYTYKGGVVSTGDVYPYDTPKSLNLRKTGAGTQVFSGNMSDFNSDVTVEGGTLRFGSGKALTAKDLTLKAGATLETVAGVSVSGTYTTLAGINIQTFSRYAALNFPMLQFKTTVNANTDMDLSQATAITLAALTDLGGHNLTLGNKDYAFALDWGSLLNMPQDGLYSLTLFTGIQNLVIGSEDIKDGWSEAAATLLAADWLTADNRLEFSSGSLILTNIGNVPEPATATLGMLALAMLAARRRRQRNDRA